MYDKVIPLFLLALLLSAVFVVSGFEWSYGGGAAARGAGDDAGQAARGTNAGVTRANPRDYPGVRPSELSEQNCKDLWDVMAGNIGASYEQVCYLAGLGDNPACIYAACLFKNKKSTNNMEPYCRSVSYYIGTDTAMSSSSPSFSSYAPSTLLIAMVAGFTLMLLCPTALMFCQFRPR